MKPMFQKRHYQKVAQLLQQEPQLTAEILAQMFAQDNPKFDRQRFITACQPGANVKAMAA